MRLLAFLAPVAALLLDGSSKARVAPWFARCSKFIRIFRRRESLSSKFKKSKTST